MRSRKAKWILAILALNRGQAMTRERLAAMLWPDTDKERCLSNLRPLVSELRTAMGKGKESLVTPDRRTIALDLSSIEVDALAFDQAAKGHQYQQAISLYQGPLMEDCPLDWASQERQIREAACLDALEKLSKAAIQKGDFESAVAFAQRGVSIAPKRDAARRTLMEVLSGAGDRNAALEVYRDYARELREESGGIPDESTTNLYLKLRSQAKNHAPTPTKTERPMGDFQFPLTSMVGREDERVDLWATLRSHRLVTITGPGGIGKTRLAREVSVDVASLFANGAFFVSLEAVADGLLVPGRVAGALSLRIEPGQPLVHRILAHLADRQLLLVLDNCEHLQEACADFCHMVLSHCSGVKILATSRQALKVTGEQVWVAPALSYPDPAAMPEHPATLIRVAMGYESVQLFVLRAESKRDGFELNRDNADAVIQICAKLEGVPLAIELAAARTQAMTPNEIAARLMVHQFGILSQSTYNVASRQRTLWSTLDWSFNLLTPQEQALLERLSVFRGGWTLQAAERVGLDGAAPSQFIPDLLQSLVSQSLVSFSDFGEEGRYRMLETVRQFAGERLRDRPETMASLRAWCLDLALQANAENRGAREADWVQRIEVERDNLQCALDSCDVDPAIGIRLCNAVVLFWIAKGYCEESEHRLKEGLRRLSSDKPTAETAFALSTLGSILRNRGDIAQGRSYHQKALAQLRELGDEEGALDNLARLSCESLYDGRFLQAKEEAQGCLEMARRLGPSNSLYMALVHVGVALRLLGDCNGAKAVFEESVTLNRELGNARAVAFSSSCLAEVLRDQGQYDEASALCRESLQILSKLPDLKISSGAWFGLGLVAVYQGQYAAAYEPIELASRQYEKSGDVLCSGNVLLAFGEAAQGEGHLDVAHRKAMEGTALFREKKHEPGLARGLTLMASIAKDLGQEAEAKVFATEAIRLQILMSDARGLASNLFLAARLLFGAGDMPPAVKLVAAAEKMRDEGSWAWNHLQQQEVDLLLAKVRAKVDAITIERLWVEGQEMGREKASEEALNCFIK